MRYEELAPISRDEAETMLHGDDPEAIALALLRLTLADDDGEWMQERALRLLTHPDTIVRRAAVLSLGHMARRHGTLDHARVLPALHAHATDPALAGAVADALDDIALYAPEPAPSRAG